jgi:phosphoribosylamine--glycine ligase
MAPRNRLDWADNGGGNMKTLIVGHGAREAALGRSMARDSSLHAWMAFANPSICRAVTESGGTYELGDVCDSDAVAKYAVRTGIDLAMVSADEPLAAGVVDKLLERGIRTIGATKAAAEIEWSKVFSRSLLEEIDPAACPRHVTVFREQDLDSALQAFGTAPVVVKPSGLTGGKGVKVMGEHLRSRQHARSYAAELLHAEAGTSGVLLEEKMIGPEFTIQAITDGETVVCPPSTYDYPYRYEGDHGPGTGGMGSFSVAEEPLPFITQAEYDRACQITRAIIAELARRGRPFRGIMNSGFFATPDGVRVTEFNARFGDPECMNVLSVLETGWVDVMRAIDDRRLMRDGISIRPDATVVIYLVSPDYALRPGQPYEFDLDAEALEARGCRVFFAACEHLGGNRYRTRGTSRAVALAATGRSLSEARSTVLTGITEHVRGPLEWRQDLASEAYVEGLRRARPFLEQACAA